MVIRQHPERKAVLGCLDALLYALSRSAYCVCRCFLQHIVVSSQLLLVVNGNVHDASMRRSLPIICTLYQLMAPHIPTVTAAACCCWLLQGPSDTLGLGGEGCGASDAAAAATADCYCCLLLLLLLQGPSDTLGLGGEGGGASDAAGASYLDAFATFRDEVSYSMAATVCL
jgi:hypothetical protein